MKNSQQNFYSKRSSVKSQFSGKQKIFLGPGLVSKPNQKQQKTHQFFKNTKIDSCSHIKFIVNKDQFQNEQNGRPVAMAYYQRPQSSYADTMARSTEFSTLNREAFSQKVIDTVSSGKKKLTPYNPNANRNRLPEVNLKIPLKNASAIQFGDRKPNKKLYVSTQKNQYGNFGKMNFYMGNPMIMAQKAQWHHKMQQ